MKKTYVLNTLLAVVVFAAAAACVLVRAFAPNIILPSLNVPNMVLLSLVALVLDHYLAKGAERCWICVPVLSAVTFGLLPWAAGFAGAVEALILAVAGGIVFSVTTLLFTTMADRMASGPAKKLAPIVSAAALWLGAQCLTGIFL